ncbi:MAG: hypothetical protein ACTSP4_08420 [Candidatus Hodarchaeales archaeon]
MDFNKTRGLPDNLNRVMRIQWWCMSKTEVSTIENKTLKYSGIEDNIRKTSLLVFFQTKYGMEPVKSGSTLPFMGKWVNSDISRIGSFFAIAIGQGDNYVRGLYGPLPALGYDYNALIFADLVDDRSAHDPRMKGKNYVLISFFYPKIMDEYVNTYRSCLKNVFTKFILNLQDIDFLKNKMIKKLERELKSTLIQSIKNAESC